jgi:hypothetical protein
MADRITTGFKLHSRQNTNNITIKFEPPKKLLGTDWSEWQLTFVIKIYPSQK